MAEDAADVFGGGFGVELTEPVEDGGAGLDDVGADHRVEPGRQFHLERRRFGGVLLRMRFARHLQPRPQPAEHLVDPAQPQRLAGALFDPRLRVLGPAKPAFAQLGHQFLRHRPPHHRHLVAFMHPGQQARHPAGSHQRQIVEHRLARDALHRRDLLRVQLMLRDQPQHGQALPRPVRLRFVPRCFQLLHHLGSQWF